MRFRNVLLVALVVVLVIGIDSARDKSRKKNRDKGRSTEQDSALEDDRGRGDFQLKNPAGGRLRVGHPQFYSESVRQIIKGRWISNKLE